MLGDIVCLKVLQLPKSGKMKDKVKYPWTLLKEPKFVSAMYSTFYSLLILVGVLFIWMTPGDLVTRNGVAITLICGGLLMLGGALGVASLHGGQWFIERAAILFTSAGLVAYMGVIWFFDASFPEEIIRTGFSIGMICLLAARYYTIRGLTLNPYKH